MFGFRIVPARDPGLAYLVITESTWPTLHPRIVAWGGASGRPIPGRPSKWSLASDGGRS
jgi:hypothetical protein